MPQINFNDIKMQCRKKYFFSDTVLSYGRCNLINQDLLDDLDFYKERNIGVINASPLGI